MRAVPLGPSVEPPYGATKRCTAWWMTHAGGPTVAFDGALYGATKRCTGWWVAHAGGPTGAFGGALYGATKSCVGW
eukprot:9172224-Pyramimonas_sp.AAC.1